MTTTVSNNQASNNPDYSVHADTVSGAEVQYVKLDVGTAGNSSPVTPANPLPMAMSGTGSMNVAQYGGVATSLGQKANASSIPVTISHEQVPEVQDLDLTPMGKFLISAFQDGYSVPLEQDSFGRGLRTLSALQDGSGNNIVTATAAPGASDRGLIARSINYGANGSTPTAEAVNSLGEQRVVSGYATTTTDTITSLGDSVVANVEGYQSALIEVSGTYAGINSVIELSVDGTNYVTTYFRLLSSNVNLNATGSLTNSRQMYRVTVAGASHVRVRSTGYSSGTMTVKICPSAFPAESVMVGTVGQTSTWQTSLLDYSGNPLDQIDNNFTSQNGIPNLFYDSANSWWSAMYGDVNGPYVQINGQVSTLELFRHGTATLSNVSASASSVTLLASNTNRRKAHFYNDSAYLCYLKFGSSASSTSFTTIVQPGGYFAIDVAPPYYGIVTGIWPTASGTMRVTEETF